MKAWSECLVIALLSCLSCPLPPSDTLSKLGITAANLKSLWASYWILRRPGLHREILSQVVTAKTEQSKSLHQNQTGVASRLLWHCRPPLLLALFAAAWALNTHMCATFSTACHTVLMNAKTSQLTFDTVVRYEWLFLLKFSALIEANFIIKRDSIFSCHHT